MRQPEKASRLRPVPSARETPKLRLVEAPKASPLLTQQVELFHRIAHELPPIFERHWQEIALHKDTIPLDPDWDQYYALAATGILQIRTARADGILVGYIFNCVGPHRHYKSTKFAEIEMFWLDLAYRGGWFPFQWFKDNDAFLQENGVKKVAVAVKNGYRDGRVGLIFRRLGYSPIETVYCKVF